MTKAILDGLDQLSEAFTGDKLGMAMKKWAAGFGKSLELMGVQFKLWTSDIIYGAENVTNILDFLKKVMSGESPDQAKREYQSTDAFKWFNAVGGNQPGRKALIDQANALGVDIKNLQNAAGGVTAPNTVAPGLTTPGGKPVPQFNPNQNYAAQPALPPATMGPPSPPPGWNGRGNGIPLDPRTGQPLSTGPIGPPSPPSGTTSRPGAPFATPKVPSTGPIMQNTSYQGPQAMTVQVETNNVCPTCHQTQFRSDLKQNIGVVSKELAREYRA
jgi:hypothetical protein